MTNYLSIQKQGHVPYHNAYNITTPVNFKSQTTTPSIKQFPQSNVVEISTTPKKEKKGMSDAAKWALGIGGTLAAIVIGGFCITKGQGKKLEKLYKDKLILSNLPERIEFKEAMTIEEGVKFAKEILGIKDVGNNFSLEAINFVNKGLVDVCNANKGKVFLPTKLRFKDMGDDTIAGVYKYINSNDFGRLTINKNYFDSDFLTKYLKETIPGLDAASKVSKDLAKNTEKAVKEKGFARQDLLDIAWSEEFKKLANKFREAPEKVSVAEKRKIMGLYNETSKMYHEQWDIYPAKWLEKNLKILKDAGFELNIDEIKKLKLKDQTNKMFDTLKQYHEKTGNIITINSSNFVPEKTIYHEMGHLQDYAKNLKKLDLKDVYFWQKSSLGSELDNRWRGITYKGFDELFEKDPLKLKKLYPDMYEHLTNKEIQKTAGKVSQYAQTSIGEFVAEVYAGLISGNKFADDVLALYRKYNGPIPGGG